MAIQTGSVTSAEHDWYATRSGVSANASLGDHKVAYYASKSFGSNASLSKPLGQIEREWLQSVGSSSSNEDYELWVAACQAESVVVGRSVDECKYNFFTTVTTSP